MSKLTYKQLLDQFPFDKYAELRPNQERAFRLIAEHDGNVLLEAPPGSGKTDIGLAFLAALDAKGEGPLFYVSPNKAQVDQVHRANPERTQPAYGRAEYPCLYYEPKEHFKAHEIPCLLLRDCKHRVDQVTGETMEPGVTPCPYYQAKFLAKQSGIVPCTDKFYTVTQIYSREWSPPAGLVIDEVHRFAQEVRDVLSYDITDYQLRRIIDLLEVDGIDTKAERAVFRKFLARMIKIVKKRRSKYFGLLEDDEIIELLEILEQLDPETLKKKIMAAMDSGKIDKVAQRETLKHLEVVVYDLRRYIHSFEYSLDADDRMDDKVRKRGGPLNYTVAYYEKKRGKDKRVQYKLTVRAYYVVPLIRKRLLSPSRTVAYSGTIGDPKVFGYDSGIKLPFHSLPSDFPPENASILMPVDTADLDFRVAGKAPRFIELRRIARACKMLARLGHRSLILTTANDEREAFKDFCSTERLDALTYDRDNPARIVAARFQAGNGEVLAGTLKQYGEGLDLPNQLAPFIFILRPGFPRQDDPTAQFEKKKFGGSIWAIWKWRASIEAQQGRGRNIRSATCKGITVFISQAFRDFVYATLPEYLKPSYNGELTFDEGIEAGIKLLAA